MYLFMIIFDVLKYSRTCAIINEHYFSQLINNERFDCSLYCYLHTRAIIRLKQF